MAKRFFGVRALILICVALLVATGVFYQFTTIFHTTKAHASTTSHYLYVVEDGLVSVYDIDNNHALVKTFSIPEQGKRGIAISPSRGMLYVSFCGTTNCGGAHGGLLAYDLVNNRVAWNVSYNFGVDQLAITPDGSKIYMPHGADSSDGITSIIDPSNGNVIGSINTGTDGHNEYTSLDGSQVYITGYTGSTSNYVHVVNPATNQSSAVGPVINGVRPSTVNGNHTLMFTTSSNTCGFQVLSLVTGKPLYTVPFSGSCAWSASTAPSHGISLSPDEKRVYVMDAPLDQLEVYDVSGLPTTAPTFVASVQLNSLAGYSSPCQTYCEREGWVLNDLSGRYVYVGDAGNVISTSTLQTVQTLPTLQNTRMLIEADWTNGVITATSTRFGLGHVTSSSAPPTPTPTSTTLPTPTPTSTNTPTPTPTPGQLLGTDTFQRTNQAHWGNASDGQTWGGDANTNSAFSISSNKGLVKNAGGNTYSAVLGATATNAQVLVIGSLSSFSNANFGGVLRWTDGNNWYKAYIDGGTLYIQKKVAGTTTTIASTPFSAKANTSYSIRFQVSGTTLNARVWATSSTEPSSWMLTTTDASLASGHAGIRVLTQGGTATFTSFQAHTI